MTPPEIEPATFRFVAAPRAPIPHVITAIIYFISTECFDVFCHYIFQTFEVFISYLYIKICPAFRQI
jgi:hypothetical protein